MYSGITTIRKGMREVPGDAEEGADWEDRRGIECVLG